MKAPTTKRTGDKVTSKGDLLFIGTAATYLQKAGKKITGTLLGVKAFEGETYYVIETKEQNTYLAEALA